LFKVSEVYKESHELILSKIKQRNYIHILVELPCRVKPHGTTQRPKTFRFDTNKDLIIIVDDRNVEQVFGRSMKDLVESIQAGEGSKVPEY